jgi:hypothetical protein
MFGTPDDRLMTKLHLRDDASCRYSGGMDRAIPSFEHGWRWWRGNAASSVPMHSLKASLRDHARSIPAIRR